MWVYQILDIISTATEAISVYLFSSWLCKKPRFSGSTNKCIIIGIYFLSIYAMTWFTGLGAYKIPILPIVGIILIKICYADSFITCGICYEVFLISIPILTEGVGMLIGYAFSHGYGQIPEREYSIRAIREAYEYGCTFFDTAEVYGDVLYYPGHNEQILGEAVEEFRKDIVLATKFHFHEEELEKGDSVYSVIRKHLENSMKNLRTDYIDLYYLHRVNTLVPVEDVADAMGKLISEGLIRGWGLSQVSGNTLESADKVTPVSAVQNLYNPLERDCEADIFPYCVEQGIGVVLFSPIASGFLSGKVTVDTQFEKVDDVRSWVPQLSKENIIGNQPILEILEQYAEKKNATSAQISLAWMLHKYPNVVPIPGSKNRERIMENLSACEVTLTDEEFARMEAALNACEVHGHRGHVETEQLGFRISGKKKNKREYENRKYVHSSDEVSVK